MKKLKKIFPILSLIIILSACQKEEDTYTSKDVKVDSVFDKIDSESGSDKNVDSQKEEPAKEDEAKAPNEKADSPDPKEGEKAEEVKTLRVNTTINFRSDPDAEAYNVIGTINEGTEIERIEEVESNGQTWSKIRFNGEEGYVLSEFLEEIQ